MSELKLLDYETRERWMAVRNQSVGASESAALFGVSPWADVLMLWALKTGAMEAPEDEEARAQNKLLKWGLRLEPAIAAGYQVDSGRQLVRAAGSSYVKAVHPLIPYMTATPDFFIAHAPDRGGRGLAEIKNVIIYKLSDWADGPPLHIQIQCQHQMAVTGYDYVVAVPLFGGHDDRPIDIERNQAFIDELEERVRWFWAFVESGEQPPMEMVSRHTASAVKALHPDDSGAEVELPEAGGTWWNQLQEARENAKKTEALCVELDTRLRDAIGGATYGALSDGRRLSLRTARNGVRQLRLEKGKAIRPRKGPR